MSRSSALQRRLDRTLGDFLALMFALRRPPAGAIANPSRIGLIQPTAIGDLIIASGLISHVRTQFPHAEVHILHGASNRAAMDLLETGLIGHTLDFTKPMTTLKYIRSLRLDILVDLVSWSALTALLCRFSGVSTTLGFATPGRFRHFLFGRAVKYSAQVHQSENFKALASQFGPIEKYAYRLRASFPKPDVRLSYDNLIVCHIRPGGSQARAKAWPADRWIELINRLCDSGYTMALSGSPADRPTLQILTDEVERAGRQCLLLAGNVTFPEFCYVLQHARLAISVDTSPVHVASALGVPVVGIHGATRSSQWGAISANSRSIDASHPAAGFIEFGFESHSHSREIMRSIPVEEVYQAAIALLAGENDWQSTSVVTGHSFSDGAKALARKY
jgi:ADP-heptose:LPS heptosyltransferase